MKNYILLLMALACFGTTNAQTNIFTVTPYKNIYYVDGIAIGFGSFGIEQYAIPTINGVNIEIDPIILFGFPMLFIPMDIDLEDSNNRFEQNYIRNGLSISTIHFEEATYNGIQIGAINRGNKSNGIAVNIFQNCTKIINGITISSIANTSINTNGISIAISNSSAHLKGVQIGLFNTTKTIKGIQIGFWNTNAKRSLPFINW